MREARRQRRALSVKHLNPRQGITTKITAPTGNRYFRRVKHLNPRQGITTMIAIAFSSIGRCARVKHLNPRQGITTGRNYDWSSQAGDCGV